MRTRVSFPCASRCGVKRASSIVPLAAPGAQVYVGHHADAQALVESAVPPVGQRALDLFIQDGAHGLAVRAEDVYAAVQVVAAVCGVVTAAHLAERGGHFVPVSLRVERPRQRLDAERVGRQTRQHVALFDGRRGIARLR
jgi:hypothetical protein